MEFQPPKGTRDIMQQEAINFQSMLDIVRNTFRKYGFSPLFTPSFEDFGLLSVKGGLGENAKDDIYYFKDKSGRELGLRFDLTMPMVRVISSNPQIKKPFKRYAIGTVWRYDNPQAMRYREFWQADVDIVGSSSPMADAECIAAACECLENLGFKEITVRLNNRKLLQDIFQKRFGIGDGELKDVFKIIDKLDKVGMDGVKVELEGRGVKPLILKKIMKLIALKGRNDTLIKQVKKEYGESDGTKELEELIEYSGIFKIEKKVKIDFSLVRGLDYYTGSVFEVDLGKGISCGGGGRYDTLINSVGGSYTPATGISLGISRIFELMKERDMFKRNSSSVFVANVSDSVLQDALKIARRIRSAGLVVETDVMKRDLKNQLSYANSIEAEYVVIVGEQELKEKQFTLKTMKTESEERLSLKDILSKLRKSKTESE